MRIGQAIAIIYSFAASWVPGLIRVLSPEIMRLVYESINMSLEKKLKVDFKFNDWVGMVLTLKEIREAVVDDTPEERVEAAYALMVLITDIETHMSFDEFAVRVREIPKLAETI